MKLLCDVEALDSIEDWIHHLHQQHPRLCISLAGVSGVGKTTLMRQLLARHPDAILLRRDQFLRDKSRHRWLDVKSLVQNSQAIRAWHQQNREVVLSFRRGDDAFLQTIRLGDRQLLLLEDSRGFWKAQASGYLFLMSSPWLATRQELNRNRQCGRPALFVRRLLQKSWHQLKIGTRILWYRRPVCVLWRTSGTRHALWYLGTSQDDTGAGR
jgi:hypothetical protein